MRGQEDRHPTLAQAVDQLVDLTGGDRIRARRRFVEEQHLWIAEQRPGQAHSLTQAFGQGRAGVVCAIDEIDCAQRTIDPFAGLSVGPIDHFLDRSPMFHGIPHAISFRFFAMQ